MMSNFFTYIAQGTAITVAVTLVALPSGLILGLFMALVHTYGGTILGRMAAGFSLLLRGVPPIVLLFILYFILSGEYINLSPFWAGSMSLGVVSSAYQMEILRGALLAVGGGQMVAARAIGMSRLQSIRYIILPQALRLAIPPWSNEPVSLLKSTAVVFLIAVPELMAKAKSIAAQTYDPIGSYLAVAIVYLAIVYFLDAALRWLERASRIPGFEMEGKKA